MMRGSGSDGPRTWWCALGVGWALNAAAASPGTLIDPTRPPGYVEPAAAAQAVAETALVKSWSVSMIRVGERRRFAIVNGELVREGDKIGEARVLEIRPRGVQLERHGKRFRIMFSVADVKKKIGSRK